MRDFLNVLDTIATEPDLVNFIFGHPTNIRFNTNGTKDMMPACWKIWEEEVLDSESDDQTYKVKKGYKAICRTVGINEEDIQVTEEDYGICVQGKTEVDGTEYSQYIELPVNKNVMSNVTSIKYNSKNGLTYVYLEVKFPEKRKISIERM